MEALIFTFSLIVMLFFIIIGWIPNASSATEEKSLWGYFVMCMTKKFACFEGRARRMEYWGFALFIFLLKFVILFFIFLLSGGDVGVINIVDMILTFIFILPNLSVTVRRMHDVNMSGWWILTVIVPIVVVFLKSDMKENKYGPVPDGVNRQNFNTSDKLTALEILEKLNILKEKGIITDSEFQKEKAKIIKNI